MPSGSCQLAPKRIRCAWIAAIKVSPGGPGNLIILNISQFSELLLKSFQQKLSNPLNVD